SFSSARITSSCGSEPTVLVSRAPAPASVDSKLRCALSLVRLCSASSRSRPSARQWTPDLASRDRQPSTTTMRQKLAEPLSSAYRERGKTLILVTHNREIIRPIDGLFARQGGSLTTIESVLAF